MINDTVDNGTIGTDHRVVNRSVDYVGRGDIDYKPVIAQAKKNQNIRHAFVEQEAFDVPWKESLKIDADYMKHLS